MKTITVYAIMYKRKPNEHISYGGLCDFGNNHESFLAVFEDIEQAKLCKSLHKEFYKRASITKVKINF